MDNASPPFPAGRLRFDAARLRSARQAAGLSQDALARTAGITVGTTARVESGYTPRPSFEVVATLARVLGVSLDDLVTADHAEEM